MSNTETVKPDVLYVGKTLTFTSTQGRVITIREQNGSDDDILSSIGGSMDKINPLHRFLCAIITDVREGDKSLGKPTIPDIEKWGLAEVNYCILKSRIHSNGGDGTISFTHECRNPQCNHKSDWEDNLCEYDGDLSQKGYKPKNDDSVKPYPQGLTTEFFLTTSRGQQVRYNILDSHGESYILDLPQDKRSVNAGLIARKISILHEGEWLRLFSFERFSRAEMREIRDSIDANEVVFAPHTRVICPKCNQKQFISLLELPTFFY